MYLPGIFPISHSSVTKSKTWQLATDDDKTIYLFDVENHVSDNIFGDELCRGYLLLERQHFHCSSQMIFYRSPEYNPNPNITYSSFRTHMAPVVSIALPSNKHHGFQYRRNNISHGTRVAPEEERTEEVISLAIPYDSRRTVEH